MPDIDIEALRPLILLVPASIAAALWVAVPDVRRRGAAVLALLWNLVGLTAVNVIAGHAGWWTFGGASPAICSVPVDLLVAWALLWSVIPVLTSTWIPLRYPVIGLVLLDVYGMAQLDPIVALPADWWWGELLAIVVCLLPGVLLAELTVRRRALRVRVALQVTLFTSVLFVAVPVLTLTAMRHAPSFLGATDRRVHIGGPVDVILIQIGAVIALIALAAVVEFYRAGGTPWPWDPPEQLVTTGPYAYLANPMQVCGVLLIALTGAVTSLPMLYVAAVVAAAFSAGLATAVEDTSLRERFGDRWTDYRGSVRNWIPRRYPVPGSAPARVYIARNCDPCSDLAAWIGDRSPVGLDIHAAEDHPEALRRIRYEHDSPSHAVNGIRAVGATMTHLNLPWALVGWLISAPLIAQFLQLLLDASGAAPRDPTT